MIFIIVCYVIKTDGQCRLKFNAGSTHCSDTGCRKWRYYTLTDGKRFTTFFYFFRILKLFFYIVNVSMLKSVAYCTVGQWQEYRKLRYVSHMSKDLYIKISAHFGIESVENLIADRRNRFINRYGETDNYLCQMLRWLVQFVWNLSVSTETAVLRVLSDILLAVDRGDVAALILLDLSAAFDTVDNEILLQRLQTTYSIRWRRPQMVLVVPAWPRSQYVHIGTSCSSVIDLICGVPQGSVLGPVLFILYTLPAWFPWSKAMVWHRTCMPTTNRSMARALPPTSMHFPPSSLPAPVP